MATSTATANGHVETTVRWPADPVQHHVENGPADTDDLAAPTYDLLHKLGLVGDSDQTNAKNAPWGLRVITADALAISKYCAAAISALGGTAVVVTAIKGLRSHPGEMKLAYVGGAVFLCAVVTLTLALVVRSDVRARATATAAQLKGRAQVASVFLSRAPLPQELVYYVKESGNSSWTPIDHFERVVRDGSSTLVAVTPKPYSRVITEHSVDGLCQLPAGSYLSGPPGT
jgi:hypothetical protein